MTHTLLQWLNSQECLDTLKLCAIQISNRAARSSIILEDAYLETEDRDTYLTAVATDLWQFIKTHADSITQKATMLLVQGDEQAFMAFLVSKYLDYCKDKRRKESSFYDYYRVVRSTLSDSKELQYVAKSRVGAWYACSQRSNLETLPETLIVGEDTYSTWAVCSTVMTKNLYEKPAIISLARHFWNQSLQHLLVEYLLPVRELVRFTCVKYPLTFSINFGDPDIASDADHEIAPSLENMLVDYSATCFFDDAWKRQQPHFDHDLIEHHLDQIASDCVAQLTVQEQLILCALDEGKPLAEIAQELGLKSPSNVAYHQKKAYMTLHRHWGLWGPAKLSQFSDIDEEEFFMFYEHLIFICKNEQTCRDSRKGMQA